MGFAHARWQNVECLLPSLPIIMCICQCSVDLPSHCTHSNILACSCCGCGVVEVMLSHPPLSPLRGGCDIIRARPYSPLYPSYRECSVCVTLCDVVCNNHSRDPIYAGYLPRTGVYCGACCAPGAVSACCTYRRYVLLHVCVLWCLLDTWCCQCLLHLS